MTVDPHISDLVAGEDIPDHLPGFWDRFDAELTSAATGTTGFDDGDGDLIVMPLTPETEEFAADADDESKRRWPSLLVAAALLLIVGAVGMLFTSRANEDAATVATEPGNIDPLDVVEGIVGTDLETPIFSVSTTPATSPVGYWRLTTLDEFDGSTWRSMQSSKDPKVVQDGLPPQSVSDDLITHTISLLSESPLLPHPREFSTVVTEDDTELTWNAARGSLLSDIAAPSPLTYTIEVAPGFIGPTTELPEGVTFDEYLAAADLSDEQVAELTKLPANFPDEIRALASELTAGHDADIDKALALQEFFREFTYELRAQPGDADDAMLTFLKRRVGSTEDFAGTFAAMMRSLGVPARVVAGFTPGDVDSANPGRFTVRGKHGHAWPEILVEQAGLPRWLEFEPSPGRGVVAVGPFAQLDHWHSIYAVYDCASDSYLPPFRSSRDDHGIHSHADGLIHIHPWTDDVAGYNATFDLFLEAMGAEVDAGGIRAAEEGLDIGVPETCLGGEPVVHLRKWETPELVGAAEPLIITDDIGREHFANDREVYLLAIAPVDAELPPMPTDRFTTLDAVTPVRDSSSDILIAPDGLDSAENMPVFVFAEDAETFAGVARTYGVSADALRAANPGTAEPLAGKTLLLPAN